MGQEDITAGQIKKAKGKANNVLGAITGDTGRQIKGKTQQMAGKVQEAIGKATSGKSPKGR